MVCPNPACFSGHAVKNPQIFIKFLTQLHIFWTRVVASEWHLGPQVVLPPNPWPGYGWVTLVVSTSILHDNKMYKKYKECPTPSLWALDIFWPLLERFSLTLLVPWVCSRSPFLASGSHGFGEEQKWSTFKGDTDSQYPGLECVNLGRMWQCAPEAGNVNLSMSRGSRWTDALTNAWINFIFSQRTIKGPFLLI